MSRNFLEHTNSGRKILNVEYKLLLFIVYLALLIFILIKRQDLQFLLYFHIISVFLFSIFYFGRQFFYILVSPLMVIVILVEHYRIKTFLKRFKTNTPTGVAVILGHSDWTKLEAWIKPNMPLRELKLLVAYLKKKNQEFSFFQNANFQDVEKIMNNQNIKEVYFLGHGNSHAFQLNTDDILYYCEFNDSEKYAKEFVHQVHCGTKHGKSLIDYVVPDENKSKCFLFRKSINSFAIEREFRKRIKKCEGI